MCLLTHSRMQTFLACRKRHHLSYVLGIKPTTEGRALRIGHAYHEGLDVWAKTQDTDAATTAAIEAYPPLPSGFSPNLWAVEQQTAAMMVAGWVWRWQGRHYEVVQSEISFSVPVDGFDARWSLAGKIDAIVRLDDGRLAVRENKTVSEAIDAGANYWGRLGIDPQASIYLLSARALGYDVKTVVWDAARKPTVEVTDVADLDEDGLKVVVDRAGQRVRTKTGTWRQTASRADGYVVKVHPITPVEWADQLAGTIAADPDYYYARRELPRTDAELAETHRDLVAVQHEIARAMTYPELRYRTSSWATCPYCPYLPLCASSWEEGMSLPGELVISDNLHPELSLTVAEGEN